MAFLPVENSQTGSINKVHDLLLDESLFAVGEAILKVEHCLIAKNELILKILRKYILILRHWHSAKDIFLEICHPAK